MLKKVPPVNLAVAICVPLDPDYLVILIVLESVHDPVCIAVDLQLDDLAAFEMGDLIYLAVLVRVTLHNILLRPRRSGPQRNGQGKNDKKKNNLFDVRYVAHNEIK